MAFEKKVPDWKAEGIEPPESLKTSGFEAGYKPPAPYFNWFMHGTGEAVKELQEKAASAEEVKKYDQVFYATYGVTTLAEILAAFNAGKFPLCVDQGLVYTCAFCNAQAAYFYYTSETEHTTFYVGSNNKWVKYSDGYTPASHANRHKKGGSDELKPADIGAVAAEELTAHAGNKNNPHGVTAAQVGAAPSVHASQHGSNGSDPITPAMIGAAASKHNHNASDVQGLATVATSGSYNDLKDAPEIPEGVAVDSALSSTSTNPVQNKVVNTALINKAPKNHASATTTYGMGTGTNYGHVKLSDATDSTSGVSDGVAATPAAVKAAYDLANGKADASHNHSASNITSGTLSVARGGTGNSSVDTTPTSGSTKMVTSGGVYTALAGKADSGHTHTEYAASSHNQAASTITAGTLAGKVQGNASAMTTLSNAQLRDIYAGTADLTAGTSSLATGTLYFVYE